MNISSDTSRASSWRKKKEVAHWFSEDEGNNCDLKKNENSLGGAWREPLGVLFSQRRRQSTWQCPSWPWPKSNSCSNCETPGPALDANDELRDVPLLFPLPSRDVGKGVLVPCTFVLLVSVPVVHFHHLPSKFGLVWCITGTFFWIQKKNDCTPTTVKFNIFLTPKKEWLHSHICRIHSHSCQIRNWC